MRATIPIVSLFSGAGGLDLGFEQAHFRPLIAYDIYPAAIETYNKNRKRIIARIGDVSSLGVRDIISDLSRVEPNEAPLGVIGGPPCQAFSQSNVYPKEDDVRRTLPGYYAALLKSLNEYYGLKFFVFENVRGLTFRRHQEEFARFRFLFEEAGFELYEALLNARDYGVPQDRPRVFIVGFNKHLFPSQIFTDLNYQFPEPLSEVTPTVYEAFEKVLAPLGWPEPAFFHRGMTEKDIPCHPNHWTMAPKSAKFHTGRLKEGEIKGRSFRVLAWNKPSWTVAYGNREIHVHPSGLRRLSIFEAMILQGFPATYVLRGNLSQQVKLVSDAVPPPLAFNIARSIAEYLSSNI